MVVKEVIKGQVGHSTGLMLHSIRIGVSDVDKVLVVAVENMTFHDSRTPLLPTSKKQ